MHKPLIENLKKELNGVLEFLKNMDVFVTRVTGVSSHIAEEPLLCVAKGAGAVLENLEIYKRNIITRR